MKKIILFLLISTLISCSSNKKNEKENISSKALVKHAKRFDIERVNSYYKLTIKNPYKGAKEHFDFILIPKGTDVSSIKESGIRIQIPIKKVIATSTTHIPMIESLGEENSLVGFPNTHYISSVKTRKLIDQGKIKDVGVDIDLNTELILDLNPDLIIGFSVNSRNKSLESLKRLGINVIYNGAWLEETPLGRAEWIKFFGLLLGKEEFANKIFNDVEKHFLELENSIEKKDKAITLFSGIMYGDTWYAPGGKSFVAKFYETAGANYVWANDSSSGSRSFSFEKVYKDAVDANYWIGVGGQKSLNSLLEANSNYGLFKAFKNKNVYSVYGATTDWGANPYFEKGVLEPDVILQDLLNIFDENFDKSKLVYYKQLK